MESLKGEPIENIRILNKIKNSLIDYIQAKFNKELTENKDLAHFSQ